MTFIQIIEYETDRPEKIDAVLDQWASVTEGRRTATHETHGRDRDDPSHFVDVVEFPSYEAAMRNSDLPETRRFAGELKALCSNGPRFVNLDVMRDDTL